MNLLKKFWNKVLCNRWFWLFAALMNCLASIIAQARGEMDIASRRILSAVVCFLFSLIVHRLRFP